MMERYAFENRAEFVEKLSDLVRSGVPKNKIRTFTPYPVHEMQHILDSSQSGVRFFTAFGALTGLLTGFAFTIGTAIYWPLITGGKPTVSVPAFLIIAYELTILFGCLSAFVGFLHLSRVPVVDGMFSKRMEFSGQFIIEVDREAS